MKSSARASARNALAAALLFACTASVDAAESSHAAPCPARQLSVADAGTKTFGSRRVTQIDIVNDSDGTCSLNGYPQLTFTHDSGAVAFVDLDETSVGANYKTPGPATIEIGSLRRASFLLGYSEVEAGGNACVPVSNIVVGFGSSSSLTLPDTISPCGRLNVSPFFISAGS